ncbi:MAG: RNase adapter RapZ [Acidimicrobiales bacterium]
MTDLTIVAGLSGAGRSSLAGVLEDLGWFVIDNMPPALVPKVVELGEGRGEDSPMALVIGREIALAHEELRSTIENLKAQLPGLTLVFLDASDETLLQRYEGTKRRHPVTGGGGVLESVHAERELLAGIKDMADIVIDSTDLTVHQLRERVVEVFGNLSGSSKMRAIISSFGYKYGLPRDSDLVLDCRFLPNPHWDPLLRPLSGLDAPVREYLLESEITRHYLEELRRFLEFLVPQFERDGRSYLSISIGCTGGRHRSVFLAEELSSLLRDLSLSTTIRHRDIDR